jgi:radical SAM protein with 4Fe4S-binding SPASM domain
MEYLEKIKEDVLGTQKAFNDLGLRQDTFCVMPFVNIILEPNGNVGLCRHKGIYNSSLGNLKQQTIKEIWESDKAVQWREDFKSGSGDTCKTELVDRRCNLCPELNKLLSHAEIANTKNPKILRLTANLNGKCNLECQMCNVWKLPNGFYTEENFWIPARELFFKDILEVDMLSGEPFIQKDTYRLIDEVSSVNPDCQWTITSNMHWILSEYIKEKLNKIVVKNLIVSIDSLEKDAYAKIRKLGDLDFVLSNLDKMLVYEKERVASGRSRLNIRMHFLIQKDNWREVKNVIKYCREKEIIPFISYLYEPFEFSLGNLNYEERVEILDFYLNILNREELLLAQRVIKPLMRSLSKIDYTYYITNFRDQTKQ